MYMYTYVYAHTHTHTQNGEGTQVVFLAHNEYDTNTVITQVKSCIFISYVWYMYEQVFFSCRVMKVQQVPPVARGSLAQIQFPWWFVLLFQAYTCIPIYSKSSSLFQNDKGTQIVVSVHNDYKPNMDMTLVNCCIYKLYIIWAGFLM